MPIVESRESKTRSKEGILPSFRISKHKSVRRQNIFPPRLGLRVLPPKACNWHPWRRSTGMMAEQLNTSGDPEVGLFIIATDDESWMRLVELGITSMRKLIDYIGATAGSVLVSGHALAPRRSAGLCPAVLKRSLFNWCHDSGLRVYVDIEAAVACVYHTGL